MRELDDRHKRLLIQVEKTRKKRQGLEPDGWLERLFTPKDRKVEIVRLDKRITQLEASINNIEQYGFEVFPTGNPIGVQIDVPFAKRRE